MYKGKFSKIFYKYCKLAQAFIKLQKKKKDLNSTLLSLCLMINIEINIKQIIVFWIFTNTKFNYN
jgi:hypothetical protein